jgi:selenocysteine-specific translation elongation factor
MELADKQKAIINALINFAWEKGGITSPQMGQDVEDLRRSLLQKPEPTKKEESRGGK